MLIRCRRHLQILAGVLVLLQATVADSDPDSLNCDFESQCCWSGDYGWEVQNGHSININEFRRTFLVGRSKPPPAGRYIRRISTKDQGIFSSCAFCSSNGRVAVDYRNWQSPTSRLSVCWSLANDTTVLNDCHPALASRQSQIISQSFEVPSDVEIILQFVSENTDERIESVVMIDKINVYYKQCSSSEQSVEHKPKLVIVEPSKKKQEEFFSAEVIKTKNVKKISLKELAQTDKRVKEKLLSRDKVNETSKQAIPANPVDPKLQSSGGLAAVLGATVPSPSSKDFNPLNDLLGKDLANFLDPNYVTDDNDGDDEDDEDEDIVDVLVPEKIKKNRKALNMGNAQIIGTTPDTKHTIVTETSSVTKSTLVIPRKPLVIKPTVPLAEFHRPLHVGIPAQCTTPGGCLFENGFCSWTAPGEVPQQARFHLNSVGLSKFIQAIVPSGELSILETDTIMQEAHMVLFDVLEWKLGTRLVGCCFVGNSLECPFATPSEAGAVLWQVGKFECPARTEKIVFICENYGTTDGICGLDNVRLHRSTDLFFIEPCQKNLLPQL